MLKKVEKSIFLTKKIVGVVGRLENDYFKVNKSIFNMIKMFNNIPILILPTDDIESVLDICDGIILPGGSDINNYDIKIVKYCIKKDIPILGICLGMQVMGSIDNDNLVLNKVNHLNVTHKINTKKGTIIGDLIGDSYVNSRHNYHITDNGKYVVSAYSNEGYIEAIEYKNNRFNVGVQWHPEDMIMYDEKQYKLIERFMNEIKN